MSQNVPDHQGRSLHQAVKHLIPSRTGSCHHFPTNETLPGETFHCNHEKAMLVV